MTKIYVHEDCGNSPKNTFIQDVTIAFAKGDAGFILDSVTEDIRWNRIGDRLIQGKDDLAKALKASEKTEELTIRHIATHGKAGAVNGTRKIKNGKTIAFCNIYEFGNAKGTLIKEITAYAIEIK